MSVLVISQWPVNKLHCHSNHFFPRNHELQARAFLDYANKRFLLVSPLMDVPAAFATLLFHHSNHHLGSHGKRVAWNAHFSENLSHAICRLYSDAQTKGSCQIFHPKPPCEPALGIYPSFCVSSFFITVFFYIFPTPPSIPSSSSSHRIHARARHAQLHAGNIIHPYAQHNRKHDIYRL